MSLKKTQKNENCFYKFYLKITLDKYDMKNSIFLELNLKIQLKLILILF